jgi:hypothetical protein
MIPPRKFYKLNKSDQEDYAVAKMNEAFQAAEQWKKLAQQARKKHIPDPEINRPDEAILKDK